MSALPTDSRKALTAMLLAGTAYAAMAGAGKQHRGQRLAAVCR
jgi:hypothetical protein